MTDRASRLGLEPLAADSAFEPREPRSVLHAEKATEREIEQSKAISLKRIADALWGNDDTAGLLQLLNPLDVRNNY